MRISTLIATLLLNATVLAAAPADCWRLRKHGQERESQSCFELLTKNGEAAVRAEGFWGLEQWDRANEQFRLATQSTNSGPEIEVRWGMLLHERFNDKDAADLFREALSKDPSNADAYLGLAIVSADSFDGKALHYVNKSLTLDPKRAKAHELAASLALENDDRDLAAAEADKALDLESDALDAMSVHAAIDLLNEHSPDSWLARVRAINPRYGAAYSHIARQLELHYRQDDAVTYYRKAIAADPRLWSAHSDLGIGLMRLGQQEEAQKELELSYNNGYRDAATVNSLRLLDSYKNYITVRDQTTILILKKTEADLLRPYFQDELHRIIAAYNTKYRLTLPGPVQVEAYPDHEDFAVRTMGMPGLGALGVTFGEVIAIDSPSARKPGDFNWGATLWHEMSHVYVLTATKNRVPRWFTEGLAVHEEGERSPEWANRITPEVIIAIREKKLLPVLKLDRGFVYPEYPSQVVVSYFQAGSICDFVKEKWGESKLLEMVHSYADRKTTPEMIKSNLDITPEEFDRQYLMWIDKRYAFQVSHFDQWRESLKAILAAAREKRWDTVIKEATIALPLYPEYVGEGSIYELLADAYRAQNDTKAEARVLSAYQRAGGQDPALLKHLADIEEHDGNKREAAETLSRVIYIYPVNDAELHRHLGDLLYDQQFYDQSAREYAATVASNPVDKAGAQFLLAKAYLAAGHKNEAEESVLAALEIAPGYVPAQKLLLELHQSPDK
ncbi:tetratricopeptide repeat protein [Edaphobacter aggregans]|uniref:tetratricopeptide repeat protein n=1 Tax=Edaphobacter aggregans TaxID=570835 RepID=UPI000557B8CD|nr:tetratricopeptide repeat protein [Edaphobacter aggregans]